jgi:hypothetical protein
MSPSPPAFGPGGFALPTRTNERVGLSMRGPRRLRCPCPMPAPMPVPVPDARARYPKRAS